MRDLVEAFRSVAPFIDALIVYLLVRAADVLQGSVKSLLTFTRLIAQNLMHRRRIDRLFDAPLASLEDQNNTVSAYGKIKPDSRGFVPALPMK